MRRIRGKERREKDTVNSGNYVLRATPALTKIFPLLKVEVDVQKNKTLSDHTTNVM